MFCCQLNIQETADVKKLLCDLFLSASNFTSIHPNSINFQISNTQMCFWDGWQRATLLNASQTSFLSPRCQTWTLPDKLFPVLGLSADDRKLQYTSQHSYISITKIVSWPHCHGQKSLNAMKQKDTTDRPGYCLLLSISLLHHGDFRVIKTKPWKEWLTPGIGAKYSGLNIVTVTITEAVSSSLAKLSLFPSPERRQRQWAARGKVRIEFYRGYSQQSLDIVTKTSKCWCVVWLVPNSFFDTVWGIN